MDLKSYTCEYIRKNWNIYKEYVTEPIFDVLWDNLCTKFHLYNYEKAILDTIKVAILNRNKVNIIKFKNYKTICSDLGIKYTKYNCEYTNIKIPKNFTFEFTEPMYSNKIKENKQKRQNLLNDIVITANKRMRTFCRICGSKVNINTCIICEQTSCTYCETSETDIFGNYCSKCAIQYLLRCSECGGIHQEDNDVFIYRCDMCNILYCDNCVRYYENNYYKSCLNCADIICDICEDDVYDCEISKCDYCQSEMCYDCFDNHSCNNIY